MLDNPKLVFYCQPMIGLGPIRNVFLAAQAIAQAKIGVSVTILYGGDPKQDIFDLAGPQIEVIQLPFCRLEVTKEKPILVDESGEAVSSHFQQNRKELILNFLKRNRIAGLILNNFYISPYSHSYLDFELIPAISFLKEKKVPIVSLMTDVFEAKVYKGLSPIEQRHVKQRVERDVDFFLVRADPAIGSFEHTFPFLHSFDGKILYTGYLAEKREIGPRIFSNTKRRILIAAGGGEHAELMHKNALEALQLAHHEESDISNLSWHFIIGPGFPDSSGFLSRINGTRLPRVKGDLSLPNREYLEVLSCETKVHYSQAGSNLIDAARFCIPTLVTPYEVGGRCEEQLLRGIFWSNYFPFFSLLREKELSPRAVHDELLKLACYSGEVGPNLLVDSGERLVSAVLTLLGTVSTRANCGSISPKKTSLAGKPPTLVETREQYENSF